MKYNLILALTSLLAAITVLLAGCSHATGLTVPLPSEYSTSSATTGAQPAQTGTPVTTQPGLSGIPVPVNPDAGLFAIWYIRHPEVLQLPYIKGGQVYVQWGDIEKVEGQYDFSSIDSQLAQINLAKLQTTVQINADKKPQWLFQKVPYNPEKLGVQVGDPQGTLMYWHPVFIRAYTDLLAAFADHLKKSPYLNNVVGVRQNFNAIGTEQINVQPSYQPLNQWKVPSGASPGVAWTSTIADDYQNTVLKAYVDDFSSWLTVFIRSTISDSLIAPYLSLIESGKLGWFQTGSEVQPRAQAGEASISRFYDYCRTGLTLGYAEPMADAWGYHGNTQDAHWASPPQCNYWRLLDDLNAGVSMLAIYGDDLTVAYNGTYFHDNQAEKYQNEFNQAFEFAAKYAGFIARPQDSPGAWIAFRHSDVNLLQLSIAQKNGFKNAAQQAALTRYVDDYTFLMDRLPDQTVSATNVGPDEQRFGAWARLLPVNEKMSLTLDDKFVQSIIGKKSEIRVTYLDSGAGSFIVSAGGQVFKTELKGSDRWAETNFLLSSTNLPADSSGARITIQTSGSGIYFHMVEVSR